MLLLLLSSLSLHSTYVFCVKKRSIEGSKRKKNFQFQQQQQQRQQKQYSQAHTQSIRQNIIISRP